MEMSAVFDVISVVKVIINATAKRIIIGDNSVIERRYDATSSASPVTLNALAMENPAPKRNIIRYGIFALSSIHSSILKGGINIKSPAPSKIPDFSLHQGPTVNFLQELKRLGQVQIHIVVVQAKEIPEIVKPGLSKEVKAAIPKMCQYLKQLWELP